MNSAIDYFFAQPEPNQSCFFALREIILQFDHRLQETVKYGMPCYVLDKKPFCYLWQHKKTGQPYLLMVQGHQIRHPALQQGARKRMKILPISPKQDIPVQTIHEIFNLNLKLYNGEL